ncbi:hypothetical protein BOX15_Mlig020824g3 [Macrostomum lignano]|uniref:Uncharacterized protein n=1 Tax=Macrostomum lignano TaxID=282301 RepID=A0A267ET53_9PLAT|nr:hypothetical protein BOX15_Mlig020824g3 [Macrostomum lignano]
MSASYGGEQQQEEVAGSNPCLPPSQTPRGRVGFCMWIVGPLIYVWGGYEVQRRLPASFWPQPVAFGAGGIHNQLQQQQLLLQHLQQHLNESDSDDESDSDEDIDQQEQQQLAPQLPPPPFPLEEAFADDIDDEFADDEFVDDDDEDDVDQPAPPPAVQNLGGGINNANQPNALPARRPDVYRQSTWVPGDQLLCYCTDSRRWVKIRLHLEGLGSNTHQLRNFLSGFSGSACCSNSDDTRLYISGGFNETVHTALSATNAIYSIHVNCNTSRQTDAAVYSVSCQFSMETRGPPGQRVPMPRDKHSAIYWRNRLLIFGGYCLNPPTNLMNSVNYCGSSISLQDVFFSPECFQPNDSLRFAWSNELLQFDLATGAWSQLHPEGTPPTPRAAHSMIRVGSRALLFGGRVLDRRTNDLFCLCLESLQWTRLQPQGSLPEPRSWTTFVQVGPSHVFCFGGYPWADPPAELRPFNNCFLYDLVGNRFQKLKLPDRPGLLWHGSCSQLANRSAFIWGGCTEDIMQQAYRRDFNSTVLEFPRLLVPPLSALCADLVVRSPLVYPLGMLKSHWPVTKELIQRRLLMSGPLLGG